MTARQPTIELVLAVHDPTRPLARAIRSALETRFRGRVSVLVVEHNCTDGDFADVRAQFEGEPVRWEVLRDGIRSPAGPFNIGVAHATSDYVGLLGSDDRFEAQAIDSAIGRIDATHPDVLIYPLRHDGKPSLPNPLVRKRRHDRLDPLRDRLMYRTAPLALIKRELIQSPEMAFTAGLSTGEDVAVSARLWFSGAQIAFYPEDAGYVIMADGPQRVTLEPRALALEFEPFERLFRQDWVACLDISARRAIVTKTIRVHVLGALFRRQSEGGWRAEDLESIRQLLQHAEVVAPGYRQVFSRADAELLKVATRSDSSAEILDSAVVRRNGAGRVDRWIAASALKSLHREAPLRRLMRYVTWP